VLEKSIKQLNWVSIRDMVSFQVSFRVNIRLCHLAI